MIKNELIINCENKEEYRFTARFARVYGLAQRLREDILIDPDRQEPVWFLWKNDLGKPIMRHKKPIVTPVDRQDIYNSLVKIAWTTYQQLEEMGKVQSAKDIMAIEYEDQK